MLQPIKSNTEKFTSVFISYQKLNQEESPIGDFELNIGDSEFNNLNLFRGAP